MHAEIAHRNSLYEADKIFFTSKIYIYGKYLWNVGRYIFKWFIKKPYIFKADFSPRNKPKGLF